MKVTAQHIADLFTKYNIEPKHGIFYDFDNHCACAIGIMLWDYISETNTNPKARLEDILEYHTVGGLATILQSRYKDISACLAWGIIQGWDYGYENCCHCGKDACADYKKGVALGGEAFALALKKGGVHNN